MDNKRRNRIPDEEWELHKETIEQLYLKQDKTLLGPDGVMEIMEKTYNFSASKAQFETRLKKWEFRKYANSGVWQTLSRVTEGRHAQEKESHVFFRGKPWSQKKVRKEIARYRKDRKIINRSQRPSHESHINSDLIPQAQNLPDYITVKTPPSIGETSFAPPRASIPPSRAGTPSPGTRRDFTFDITGSSATICQPSSSANQFRNLDLFASQLDSFHSSPVWPGVDTFLPDSEGTCQGNFGSSFAAFDVFESRQPDNAIILDERDSTYMGLTPLRHSNNAIIEGFQSFPDVFMSTISSLSRIRPAVQHMIQQFGVPVDLSGFPLQRFCQPSTCELLLKQSPDMRVIHLITSRLINSIDALDALQFPENSADKLFKAGIENIFSSGGNTISELLDSIPAPYCRPLEQGLFCAAVELGAVHIVEVILKRGLNPDNVILNLSEGQFYPLERSCSLLNVDVTRALLDFGANPNKFVSYYPLYDCTQTALRGCKDLLDIVELLLKAGAKMDPADMLHVVEHCDADILKLLVTGLTSSPYELFISNGIIARILKRYSPDSIIFAVSWILNQEYAEGIKDSDVWHEALTASLSNAARQQRGEAIELLLRAGARPNCNCLINAIRSKNIKIVERFLDLGVDANAPQLPTTCRSSPSLQDMELHGMAVVKHTALSTAMMEGFDEAFNLFKQREFVLKNDILKFEFKAACRRGSISRLVNFFLPLSRHLSTEELDEAIMVAISYDREVVALKLLLSAVKSKASSLSAAVYRRNESMLIEACRKGMTSLVGYLLFLPGNLSTKGSDEVMMVSIRQDHEAIVMKLLASGIDPGHKSLWYAVHHRRESLASLFMNISYIERRNFREVWFDILREAVLWGNFSIVKGLILAGVSLNNETTLSPDEMLVLLPKAQSSEDGPRWSEKPRWRVTPLSLAILKEDRQVVDFLLASGAQLNVYDPYYTIENGTDCWRMSALSASVINQDLELCRKLLVLGSDPFDNIALWMAVSFRNEKILDELFKAFIRRYPSGNRAFGADALLHALDHDDIWMLELLAKYTDANHLINPYIYRGDVDRISPLGWAIKGRPVWDTFSDDASSDDAPSDDASSDSAFLNNFGILLGNGGDPNSIVTVRDKVKQTALLCAIETQSLKRVQTLVEAGAHVTSEAKWGITRTPLQYAAELGDEAIVQYLLRQGATPNEDPSVRGGATALQLAAIKGYVGIASILLEGNANVNAEPARFEGRTAFEGAAEYGRIEMMLFLVQKGVDLLSDDRRQYRRAIKFAEKNGQAVAKELADQLCEAATRNETLWDMLEPGEVEMTKLYLGLSSDCPL
ncbi:ankyrin repeat-containing domain protein [Xylariaceae sp. AK1471]|nr:ankyrin repeat-containing domain protein [Xylariaceae sp. AK1471]